MAKICFLIADLTKIWDEGLQTGCVRWKLIAIWCNQIGLRFEKSFGLNFDSFVLSVMSRFLSTPTDKNTSDN